MTRAGWAARSVILGRISEKCVPQKTSFRHVSIVTHIMGKVYLFFAQYAKISAHPACKKSHHSWPFRRSIFWCSVVRAMCGNAQVSHGYNTCFPPSKQWKDVRSAKLPAPPACQIPRHSWPLRRSTFRCSIVLSIAVTSKQISKAIPRQPYHAVRQPRRVPPPPFPKKGKAPCSAAPRRPHSQQNTGLLEIMTDSKRMIPAFPASGTAYSGIVMSEPKYLTEMLPNSPSARSSAVA